MLYQPLKNFPFIHNILYTLVFCPSFLLNHHCLIVNHWYYDFFCIGIIFIIYFLLKRSRNFVWTLVFWIHQRIALRYFSGSDCFSDWILSYNRNSWCLLTLLFARNYFFSGVILAKLGPNTVKTETPKYSSQRISYGGFGMFLIANIY